MLWSKKDWLGKYTGLNSINTGKHPLSEITPHLPIRLFQTMTAYPTKSADAVRPDMLSRARTFLAVLGGVYLLIVLLLTVPFIQSQ